MAARKVNTMTMVTAAVQAAIKLAAALSDGVITRDELKNMTTTVIDAIFDALGTEQITL